MDRVYQLRFSIGFLVFALLLSGCGGGSGDSSAPFVPGSNNNNSDTWTAGVYESADNFAAQCEAPRTGFDSYSGEAFPDRQGTAFDEKMWLRSWTYETYLWYDEVPDNDPDNYSINGYFAQLKTSELTASGKAKDNFHFSEPTEEYKERTQAGTSSGYGIRWEFVANSAPRELIVRYTEPGSPAATSNIPRGARLVTIDDIDFVNTNSQGEINAINAALFPTDNGETHAFGFELVNGESLSVSLTSSVIELQPVRNVQVIETDAGRIGYFQFNSFITPAQSDLINAFQRFVNTGVNELVIDLRYNGGGSLALSSQIGYMVAGPNQTNNAIFGQLVYNDKTQPEPPFPFYDREIDYVNGRFTNNRLPSPELTRVFILSTQGTCSASESLINGLRGIDVEVILIGDRTCGKPFGFYPTDNCGTTYYTIQFQGVNEKGFGDYADGFIPSSNPQFQDEVQGCSIADDFTQPLGSVDEGLLSAALYYAQYSECPAPRVQTAQQPTNEVQSSLSGNGLSIKTPNPFIESILTQDYTPIKEGEME